ncbi:hypothetical protein QOZ88_15225 [Blastococcus sp. BMG 814]|uniref:Uncharacterized protein n=1 Tax=Blastococcus carthaginiensis TaxID=3050034 RepID=A0ABT9IEI9_9ACTN|nr:hypothetical protein [Blastococcus carthaginiensis]MDP5183988.1 hypothetical protein [Blastococcus carthaginiensis]
MAPSAPPAAIGALRARVLREAVAVPARPVPGADVPASVVALHRRLAAPHVV